MPFFYLCVLDIIENKREMIPSSYLHESRKPMEKITIESERKIKTYIFKVVIEDDFFADGKQAYHAYCPSLKGATTWGYTKEEALKNIREVVEMTIESMVEHGEPIPEEPDVQVFNEPLVAVTL